MAQKQVSKLVQEGEVLCAIRFVSDVDEDQGSNVVVEAKSSELPRRELPRVARTDDTAPHDKHTCTFKRCDDIVAPLLGSGRRHMIKVQERTHTASNCPRGILNAC